MSKTDIDHEKGNRDRHNHAAGETLDRRTVLRGIATTGVAAAGGLTVGSGAAAAKPKGDCDLVVDDTGKADYRSIQNAENAAAPGATICVDPGTYEESVTVNTEDLVIKGTSNRHAVDVIGQERSAISIDADGVTVMGLSVHNPGRLIGIKVEPGVAGATVSNNLVSDVGPTSSLGVTGILAGGGNTDLDFSDNIVENLRQAGEGPFNPTTNGIFLDHNGGGSTGADIVRNKVKGLSAEYASLGILTIDATDVRIEDNSVRDVSADDPDDEVDFAEGINVDGGSDVTVRQNDVRDITSDEQIGAAFVADGAVDPETLTVTHNNLVSRIGFGNNTESTLDAPCNYWGHPSGPYDEADSDAEEDNPDGKGSDIVENPGAVDFTPWSRNRITDQQDPGSCRGGTEQRGGGRGH